MAKKLGKDYYLWIESAVAGTYNIVKGQQELEYAESAGTVDTTTKEDFPYGTSQPGNRNISLDFSCIPDLPDASGYTRFETVANSATPQINIQVRKGGPTGGAPDVVFQCLMNVANKTTSMGNNAPVGSKWQLTNAAAPTTNALA